MQSCKTRTTLKKQLLAVLLELSVHSTTLYGQTGWGNVGSGAQELPRTIPHRPGATHAEGGPLRSMAAAFLLSAVDPTSIS